MKKAIGYTIVAVLSFAAGAATGWFTRKKTSEVQFEVTDILPVEEEKSEPPEKQDLKDQIDAHFGVMNVKTDDAPAVPELYVDTQKEQYFKKWKAEEAVERYDTRTKEDPEDPVVLNEMEEEFDQDFLDEAAEENDDENDIHRPEIEAATIEDWNHWLGIPDGKYECHEIVWFSGDGVIADERMEPIDNPGKLIRFDIAEKFAQIDDDSTGDPNVRVVYDHREKSVFQIIRRRGSYSRMKGMEEFGSGYSEDEDDGDV